MQSIKNLNAQFPNKIKQFLCLGGTCSFYIIIFNMIALNLKTAIECARGFYISRRGAETRRFIRILKHLKRIAAFHPGGEDL